MLGLIKEFLIFLGIERHNFESVLFAVGFATNVKDGAVSAAAECA
jgi:hypothetical protein